MAAKEYDKKINATIPYYTDFYDQTIDVVEQCKFDKMDWLDLGCGTGSLEERAFQRFSEIDFVLIDPSEKMLEQAKMKLKNKCVQYICMSSTDIQFRNRFHIITAIQSHHYLQENERKIATKCVYQALKEGGIYISFENIISDDEEVKEFELLRWGRYQQRHGKTEIEAKEHNARCGTKYYPITIEQHIQLLRSVGFRKVHVFWISYMQMGIYAMK